MSLAEILETEVAGEIAAIEQQASQKAGAIIAQANERAAALTESRSRLLANEKAAALTRARSAANLDTNAQQLNAANTLQSRAFVEAEVQLRAIPQHPEYQGILSKLLQEAHAALPSAVADKDTATVSPGNASASAAPINRAMIRSSTAGLTRGTSTTSSIVIVRLTSRAFTAVCKAASI